MMKCKICHSQCKKIFVEKVLGKFSVDFYYCGNCEYLQIDDYFWKKEAYASSITQTDTGILERNLHFSRVVSPLLYYLFGKDMRYLDYGGGYGIFTRRMRDLGFDFYWTDPYSPNLMARGFEYDDTIDPIMLVTLFECFEHFEYPMSEMEKISSISKNILFSTSLLPIPVPISGEWDYYSFEHGQHISFYTRKTLTYLAKHFGVNYYYLKDNIHLFTESRISNCKLKVISNRYTNYFLQKLVSSKMKTRTYDDEISQRNRLLNLTI